MKTSPKDTVCLGHSVGTACLHLLRKLGPQNFSLLCIKGWAPHSGTRNPQWHCMSAPHPPAA